MSISRRTALKQILWVAGGTVLIPACIQKEGNAASIPLRHLKVDAGGEKLLAELAETIIPATDTPGAKDLYLHQFTLTMMDDCHSKEEQEAFEKGMKAFDQFSQKQMNSAFVQLSPAQRIEFLQRIEGGKQDIPNEVAEFYKKVKALTVHGYVTSKHYLTKVQVYELVPGRYRGCLPVGSESKVRELKAV